MDNSTLAHYGTPRHSGRYPWGSGKNPQRSKDFLSYVNDMKKQGLSEVEIAKGMGMTTSQLRAKKTIAREAQRKDEIAEARRLKDKGYSNVAIGEKMGKNESSIRSLLDPTRQERSEITRTTADTLKSNVDKHGYIDVGTGAENYMGVPRTKLKAAIELLKEEGYKIHYTNVEQLGTGKNTSLMVLTGPDKTGSDVYKNKDKITVISDHSEDGGRSYSSPKLPVKSIDSKRVQIRYAEDGGSDADGVIYIRPGAKDLSMGDSKYAQVRIGVDDTHYMKGMTIYKDDMPPGVDVIFNTTKPRGTPLTDVLKPMKTDENGKIDKMNPFNASIKEGGQRGALNIINEEGDWHKWDKNIASQVLSKQLPSLAQKQLDLSSKIKLEEFKEISSLTNPSIKKRLLDAFADDCDSSAVHLKAAALPRQNTHVILPFSSIKETEVYAPNYSNGEKLVLIRYPHGGKFEIPELIVNNKNQEAKKVIGNAIDAVGINSKTAARLSGADFDGDFVIAIPNNKGSVKTQASLKALENFDPRETYKGYPGMTPMSPRSKQQQMGQITNLIADMTIKGANNDEIARAVKHSMVVIDAEKHNLDYKRSASDNGIAELKEKYQGGARSGASTLISKASSEQRVFNRREVIDPKTGEKSYLYPGDTYTTSKGETKVFKGQTYVDKKGNEVPKQISSTKMAETKDAFSLSSGTPIETVYASYANKMKALANEARKESLNTKPTPYSPSAKKTYAKEVDSLNAKLNVALKNAPLERKAQIVANSMVAAKKAANPNMGADELKKVKGQSLAEARVRVGAKKTRVSITDNEWKAIQSGAISTNKLNKILNNTDLDAIKKRATPRTKTGMTAGKLSQAKNMLARGYTQAEVAEALGVSVSTLNNAL